MARRVIAENSRAARDMVRPKMTTMAAIGSEPPARAIALTTASEPSCGIVSSAYEWPTSGMK